METHVSSPISASELAIELAKVDSAVVLVPNRILRRVIWQHRSSDTLGFHLLKQRSYILPREALLPLLEKGELHPRDAANLSDQVILLGESSDLERQDSSREKILLDYWRLLFRARLRIEWTKKFPEESTPEAEIQKRIEEIGRTEFAEIEAVLTEEHHFRRPPNPREAYIHFAVLYGELSFFACRLLPVYFPSLKNRPDIEEILKADIDEETLFHKTRPREAPLPDEFSFLDMGEKTSGFTKKVSEMFPKPREKKPGPSFAEPLSPEGQENFLRKADEARDKGNIIRVAIAHTYLAQRKNSSKEKTIPPQALAHLEQLTKRLQWALQLTDEERDNWQAAVVGLLPLAATGFWTEEARLLYDLQKVCLDREKGLYDVKLGRWLFSWGKQPLKKELPARREVLPLKHLRNAFSRVPRTGLTLEQRERLEALLHKAIKNVEEHIRTYFREPVEQALENVDLKPANLPEKVSRDKLREELLDRIVKRGMLNMSDLRDAVSRNQVKLSDLAHPKEFVSGDKLLKLNKELADSLRGVYHPGEFYLRWLQSFTSLAFGTRLGRFITLYMAVPFGGAFVALKGLFFLYLEIHHFFGHKHPEGPAHLVSETLGAQALTTVGGPLGTTAQVIVASKVAKLEDPIDHLTTPWTVALLGLFIFLMLHTPAFRKRVLQGFRLFGQGLYYLFIAFPRWLWSLPLVKALLTSQVFVFLGKYLAKPLMLGFIAFFLAYLFGGERATLVISGTVTFVAALAFFSTRIGRITDEILSNWLVESLHHFSFRLIPVIFWAIWDAFKWLVREVERILYSVDEWLYFQNGETSFSLGVRAVLGLLWGVVSYVVRLLVILIVEPSINPIKHFPVVTVAGKFMLHLLPVLTKLFEPNMGIALGGLLASAIVFGTPGIFGFLVWELKENWRLYEANRATTLRPVQVGHHGETVVQLLKPGFHSGTIPHLFSRWRRAERAHHPKAIHKCDEKLAEVAKSVQHFVKRDFLHLLQESGRFSNTRLSVGPVQLWVTRIAVTVSSASYPDSPMMMAFDLKSGWLTAQMLSPGWYKRLTDDEKGLVTQAWRGLCQKAKVSLLEREIRRELSPQIKIYDVKSQNLLAWPDGNFELKLVYDLTEDEPQRPKVIPVDSSKEWPVLDPEKIFLSRQKMYWSEWVKFWEKHSERG